MRNPAKWILVGLSVATLAIGMAAVSQPKAEASPYASPLSSRIHSNKGKQMTCAFNFCADVATCNANGLNRTYCLNVGGDCVTTNCP